MLEGLLPLSGDFVESFGVGCAGGGGGGAGGLGERDGGLGSSRGLRAAFFAVSGLGGVGHCCCCFRE